jgi:hypothetical protein
MVGRPHHFSVMFDDQHRIADVAEILQEANQSIVVTWMQTDGRFVEHIESADQ